MEFLTAAGLPRYRDAMASAADWTGTVLGKLDNPGLVDGYAARKLSADEIDLDIEAGVGLSTAVGEAIGMLAGNSAVPTHPGYLAHLHCPPALPSLAAEVLISAFNQSMDSFDQAPSATAAEQSVIEYLCGKMGYPEGADGTFTSGGTASNLQALLIARNRFAQTTLGWDIGRQGLPPGAAGWRVVCTRQTHFSVHQALGLLGLGSASVVEVPTDDHGRMQADALARTLEELKQSGHPVMAVVLTAGTTDTGAIDPLRTSVDVAHAHGVWAHIDACAGGCLMFSQRYRHLLDGIEAADSVAIDFHKLFFQAISCSALLVRDGAALNVASGHVDYLNPESDEYADVLNLVGKSIQTTRRFDALKVVITVRALGERRVAEMIDATVEAAAAAGRAVSEHAHLELVVPVTTNSVVLRFSHTDLTDAECDDVNGDIRRSLASSGRALVGRTRVSGLQAIKLTFVNPLVTVEMADKVIAEIADEGAQILRARGRDLSTV